MIYFGLEPRLASERLEAGENRFDKIFSMIKGSKYSIHDLSMNKAKLSGDTFRMNMPFEFGLDFGFRMSGIENASSKRFLVFERDPYDLKRALSDTAGQDVEFHKNEISNVIEKTRNFFRVELGLELPGSAKLEVEYATFLGWMLKKKLFEGHSENTAKNLPTRERLDEMKSWNNLGRPSEF